MMASIQHKRRLKKSLHAGGLDVNLDQAGGVRGREREREASIRRDTRSNPIHAHSEAAPFS